MDFNKKSDVSSTLMEKNEGKKENVERLEYLMESPNMILNEDVNEIPDKVILNCDQNSMHQPADKMENVPINNDDQNLFLSGSVPINSIEKNDSENVEHFVEITVTEPQKIGEGMSAYLAYRVITHTNMPIYQKHSMTVSRRFSDFLGLHTKLSEKYLRIGRILPPAPEKSVIGMTKIKISQSNDSYLSAPSAVNSISTHSSSLDWVERRRASLQRFLVRTSKHPVLGTDPDFRSFLETDGELPRAIGTKALSSAGVLRLFNKVGETVNKITYKMDETDPWFEEKVDQIDALDLQYHHLHTALEDLVNQRRELSCNTGAVAKSLAVLSGCEEHNGLARVLSQMADIEEKVELLRSEQTNSDFFIFSEMLKDYIGLIGAIKEVFHERVKVFQNWQHSQFQLTKKREMKAKFELAGRNEKLDQAAIEVLEWESKVMRGQEEFENISRIIKKEVEYLDVVRIKEFKDTVIKYLEDHMAHQQQLVQYWEDFLPKAKAIA